MAEATIKAGCKCNYGFVETGTGSMIADSTDLIDSRKLIQVYTPDAIIRFSNRDPDEEMDDLDLRCVRCGSLAMWK